MVEVVAMKSEFWWHKCDSVSLYFLSAEEREMTIVFFSDGLLSCVPVILFIFFNFSQQQGGGRWQSLQQEPQPVAEWTERGPRDERVEAELFASVNSGINFDKYEEIPVEATGDNVPPPISTVRFISSLNIALRVMHQTN